MSMSNRGKLRRKMVLPVAVLRGNGEEKQLAHTLDVTETSARLGGLRMPLEPGEVIEIQRGGARAKFRVYWAGAPGSELEGQAGIRGLDTGKKSIWSIHLPPDQPDVALDAFHFRHATKAGAPPASFFSEQRPGGRHECNGGATLRAPGSNYPFRAQIRSIHLGGIEVESITTLPLNTVVNMEMQVEGMLVETTGMVASSTHRIGMEISFHKTSPEVHRKIVQLLQKLKQKAWDEQQVPPLPDNLVGARSIQPAPAPDPLRELVGLCQAFCAGFDHWRSSRTAAEIEELRRAVTELQQMLSPKPALEMRECLAASLSKSNRQA
jgi:hypothetical protein